MPESLRRHSADADEQGASPAPAAPVEPRREGRKGAGAFFGAFADDLRATAGDAALSPVRTFALTLSFAIVVAVVIMAVVTVVGIAGAMLVSNGVVSFERLTSPATVVAVMFVGSILIAGLVSMLISYSLVRPVRRMTAAMGELARGNFDVRLEKEARATLREVDEFAASFNTAAAELGSTEMMRAGFISDFSHEFRTPINALCGFAQLARGESLSAEERNEYLGIIVEEAQRLAGLSERILLLSKMEAAAILPDVERVDVAESLRRAAAIETAHAQRCGVDVSLTLDPCVIRGNVDYLVQLWTNLFNNAIKFSPEGGTVSVALYGGRRGEEGRAGVGDEVVCWISDEGEGMDAETREHLFDRFYQGDSSHASEGSGLGLALCRRIVELHGGTIDVESSPGAGSVFEVRLPSGCAGLPAGGTS